MQNLLFVLIYFLTNAVLTVLFGTFLFVYLFFSVDYKRDVIEKIYWKKTLSKINKAKSNKTFFNHSHKEPSLCF